ncbi:adenosylmethionine-8-amino-7-oxononanoate aminotransferase [Nonlabens sp. Hel1_33_55]|uniref:adenosylmethionine--8-amino-7-oxononanoate transaminase n=1 Tax=Nonlabens sp. Hel1_33_55 TaxID=1336802 RepID=UPI000875BDE6|nr:adenosylmethionine--8-amino-7-oxononanoate transaminase [Nonlabens sp. Hel1_33_55]SCY35739.1 adenosylmethionine-8-amino-7-oxononanoate aminotransferase [Nonlabens sp. Hel1_33_55]
MNASEILKKDAANIWHPLTQHKTAMPPLAISHAQGNYLFDHEGIKYFDAISSWYTCSYGHCNSTLISALQNQSQHLHHVVFAGMTHEPAVNLSEKILSILPANQSKLFFSENGSTSVEIALKMAFQYHFNRGEKRLAVIALDGGFHGDTFGAMSASGLSVYNGPFEDLLIKVERIPVPTQHNIDEVLLQIDRLVEKYQFASFIYEPLVQGAAAMQMNDASVMDKLLSRFRESGILTIADEVMTGFGKTGTYFASDQILTKPDIICLSKALTGGIMPMAITSCTQEVYEAFLSDDTSRGFFHGHTYSGNPLGCAVAGAAIDLLISDEIQDGIKLINNAHALFAKRLQEHSLVAAVRHCGVILAFDLDLEMQRYGNERNEIFQWFWKKGIFLRPLGKTIYLVPPFTTTAQELEFLYETILEFLESR